MGLVYDQQVIVTVNDGESVGHRNFWGWCFVEEELAVFRQQLLGGQRVTVMAYHLIVAKALVDCVPIIIGVTVTLGKITSATASAARIPVGGAP